MSAVARQKFYRIAGFFAARRSRPAILQIPAPDAGICVEAPAKHDE